MLVNENTVVHCLFMLVHSALTNVNKHNDYDFNNALVNVFNMFNILNIQIWIKYSFQWVDISNYVILVITIINP